MAKWDINKYFSLQATNEKCTQLATDLLNSYSLTRGCLETLGKDLQDQLEFGFFEEGAEIIIQGESGRDVFILCSGIIDVLVNDQVVVQMNSPTLVGDKGVVSATATRAASIRIAGEKKALVLKIPMESFIRNFKDGSIEDESFSQEKSIFENVFQTVQERLFEFMHLQKSLWEQASNTIQLLNQQIYAKQLDNQIEPDWDEESWKIVQNYLNVKFNIKWPDNIPLNAKNLNIYLRQYLDKKYQNTSEAGVLDKKKLEWRNSLTGIANRVLKDNSDVKKPVPALDLELFNPNIYRMRLTGLQNQLEKRYSSKQIKSASTKKRPPSSFFGTGERSNEFNLSTYLDYFYKMHRVNNPRRLLAQVGQKCALIAAECENNFNSSVVKMQKFLEEVKSRNISLGGIQSESKTDPKSIKTWIGTLIRGIHHYRDSTPTVDGQTLGIIKFSDKNYPTFSALIKAHRVKFTRDQMSQAFMKLIKSLQFQTEYLSKQMLFNIFHLCGIERGDTVPESEIKTNYWFPLSNDVKLNYGDNRLFNIKACTHMGGEFWSLDNNDNKVSGSSDAKFSLTSEDNTIILILSTEKLPWVRNKTPESKVMIELYLPLMQWLIDKHIELLLYLQSCRDEIVEEWKEIRDGIVRSQKIAAFEQKALKLPKADYDRIIGWLSSSLGIKFEPNEVFVSSKISKRIYNFFLHSATITDPELSVEQRGNQAYTKWRNLLFELVDQIPALNKVVTDIPVNEARPVLDILTKHLTPLLSPILKETWKKQNPITSGTPHLNMLAILHPDKHPSTEEPVRLFNDIKNIFAKNIYQLVLEIKQHKQTLNDLFEYRSKSDVSIVSSAEHVDMRQESIKNLIKLLEEIPTPA